MTQKNLDRFHQNYAHWWSLQILVQRRKIKKSKFNIFISVTPMLQNNLKLEIFVV